MDNVLIIKFCFEFYLRVYCEYLFENNLGIIFNDIGWFINFLLELFLIFYIFWIEFIFIK